MADTISKLIPQTQSIEIENKFLEKLCNEGYNDDYLKYKIEKMNQLLEEKVDD